MNNIKLFVDDVREPPDSSWSVVRKVEAAIKFIDRFRPTTISLDHDIEGRPDDETFKPVAYFIGEKYQNDTMWADDLGIVIHSDNPVGAAQLKDILVQDYGIYDVELRPYSL